MVVPLVCYIERQRRGSKMKKQTQHNICWSQVGFLSTVLIFSMLNLGKAEAQNRKFIDPKSENGKLVGIVTQLDGSGGIGNGFVIGAGGCNVLANVHTTYGIGKDSQGNAVLVNDMSVGRKVRFQTDFDSKTKKFKREIKASVIEIGNFVADTRRGRTQDVAVLKLDTCLGPEYGTLAFDHEASSKRFPEADLVTVGFGAINGEVGIIMEECSALQSTPTTGLIITNCFSEPISSGMMYLERRKADGKLRLVGIHQGRETLADGTNVPVAVYARAFNPIVERALGENSPIAIGPIVGDRAPQNDQTALLVAPSRARTVVR